MQWTKYSQRKAPSDCIGWNRIPSERPFLKSVAPESSQGGTPVLHRSMNLSGAINPVSGDNNQNNKSILTCITGPRDGEKRLGNGAGAP